MNDYTEYDDDYKLYMMMIIIVWEGTANPPNYPPNTS